MGYEKVHDWKNWKESDWVLKNNKDGGATISLLFHEKDDKEEIKLDVNVGDNWGMLH